MFQQIVDSRGTPKVVGDATNSVEAVWKENHYMLTKRRLNPSWNSLTYYESTSVNRSLHQPSTINHQPSPTCSISYAFTTWKQRHDAQPCIFWMWWWGGHGQWDGILGGNGLELVGVVNWYDAPKMILRRFYLSKGRIRQIKSNRPVSWKGPFFMLHFFHVKRLWRFVALFFLLDCMV